MNLILQDARQVLQIEADALTNLQKSLSSSFAEAVELFYERCPPGKIVVMGVGKSGHVCNKIAATLASTGTPAFFVHPTEASHGDLGMISKHDVVLAISYSGKSDEMVRVLPYLKRNRIPLVAITGSENSPLSNYADCHISGEISKEACPFGLAPTASTTAALGLGDALAVCLLKRRGFTSEDFAVTHPHGALGRRLLVTVADIMLTGQQVPSVQPESSIRHAIVEISRGGIGICAVVDSENFVQGIFTDGDLRRSLDQNVDIANTPIMDVMTLNPVVMPTDKLAAEAAELMEQNKVTAILVVDPDGRLIGAFNMRVLLESGVV